MDDVYAGLTELLRPASGGRPPARCWLVQRGRPGGKGAAGWQGAGWRRSPLGVNELHVPAGLDYAWTEDTGGDELLRAGDRLLVLVTADGQDYYILQKAVFS